MREMDVVEDLLPRKRAEPLFEVVGELESLIAEHPYREGLRAQLMLALYRSDRQAHALEAYQDARRALAQEVGDITFPHRALEEYTVALEETVEPAAIRDFGFKIVVDYSYGAASTVMPTLLGKLGADVLAVNPYVSTAGRVAFDEEEALLRVARRALHGPAAEYGIVSAAFGVGMVTASLALTVKANRRPAAFWLTGGVVAGAVGMVLTGIAPSAAVACAGQAVAGAGNTAELVGTDTLVQERVPAHMLGRAFGTVYGGAQLGSALAYVIARSPVGKAPMPKGKTKRFKQSWFVAVDGKRWAGEMRAIPAGAEVMVVNDQPYSRKVEVGAIRTSGFKLVEDARQATLRRFPTMAVEKTFVLLPGGYVLKSNGRRVAGRRPNKSQRAGERLTYPAVIIKARR